MTDEDVLSFQSNGRGARLDRTWGRQNCITLHEKFVYNWITIQVIQHCHVLPASSINCLRDNEVSCTKFRKQLKTFMFQNSDGLRRIAPYKYSYLLTYLLTYLNCNTLRLFVVSAAGCDRCFCVIILWWVQPDHTYIHTYIHTDIHTNAKIKVTLSQNCCRGTVQNYC